MGSLRSRKHWERVFREGASRRQGGLVVYVLSRGDGHGPRLGVVVSRRVGKAVERNRLRRRLKTAWKELMPEPEPDVDCVVVARPEAARETFRELAADLAGGLRSLAGIVSLAARSPEEAAPEERGRGPRGSDGDGPAGPCGQP